ncbi:hypothetical protein PGT21_016892 [Puccinia graminis f. sp. tritici]|uniref:Uncharacterized protein n=1 Tax=Puccinia graminis f. sp. tritici TaxID=56615 RepID=A0A5B0PXV8_PUCGR|nr:hypothetical protein PGT21_016892 [Puccinia graminis f. sp. tritici]
MAQLLNNQPQPNSQPPSMATPTAQPLLDPSFVSPSEISVLQTPDSLISQWFNVNNPPNPPSLFLMSDEIIA